MYKIYKPYHRSISAHMIKIQDWNHTKSVGLVDNLISISMFVYLHMCANAGMCFSLSRLCVYGKFE